MPVAEHNHTIEALAVNEDEPQIRYQMGWKTILAVLTLSMGNVCADLHNTAYPTAHSISFRVGGAFLAVVGSAISGSAHKITDIIGRNILTRVVNASCVS